MNDWPKTVDGAVDRLIEKDLEPGTLEELRKIPPDDRILLHMNLGMWIRNHYGLWIGNEDLIKDAGKTHPDDVSWVILDRLFQKISPEESFD